MKLVICEKPSVAQKIAHALGKEKVSAKSLYGVPYYEVERDGQRLVVVSAAGHLYTLRQKSGSGGYPVFDVEWAPVYEVEGSEGKKEPHFSKKYLDAIASVAPGAEEYVCACDFDVEGSLIGYNIIRFACGGGNATRMKFSALTPGELDEAFAKRGAFDLQNALAGEARHILDWFYGINLSRALMSSIRSAGKKQIMSIGRVQGPALAILAKREKEIASFVPKPYWEVSCTAKKVRFLHERGRFEKKEEAYAALSSSGTPGVVQKVERKEYLQPPPPPFDLTSLQLEAYRLFNFQPAGTLELAQSLYEASLISYPRTSSQKLPARLGLKRIIEQLGRQPAYSSIASRLLSQNRLSPLEGKKEDPAHPAIHPTGLPPKNLSEKQAKLYDLIVKRFLSCFEQPAVREAQKISILSGTEGYVASGNKTVKPGWFEAYAPYTKLEEALLPEFSEGERVPLFGFKVEEKKTQPPKRYTPASIVSELEKRGLGTKATRAAIIETLFKRGYVDGKSIKVTPFGMALYELLSKVAPEIMDEELTRKIEEEMEKIQDGENERRAIEDGKEVLRQILSKFEGKERAIGSELMAGLVKNESPILGKCVRCGSGELRVIQTKQGKQFVGCTAYPSCTAIYPLPQNAKIVPLGKTCELCKTPRIEVVRKGRRNFEMCLETQCETKKDWGKKEKGSAAADRRGKERREGRK
ncbi:MAG: DNA topoisomerase I [Candidatus Micrarchaeota archaeon]|nr:DNA topoisomerase I [Candidatus Micrarchaeota archaeon]